jgi:tRNA wybutosine-synthesizing protein 2
MPELPIDKMKKILQTVLSKKELELLPEKWEKIGQVGIIKLDKKLIKYSGLIGKTYSDVLQCKSILNDTAGIIGEYRQPQVSLIFGDKNTETIHKENDIKYKIDPQKIMFSSGNMNERSRMANISNKKEIVVDLFAGIGYFSLPIAVYSRPKKIYALEKNPIAFDFLKQNISLNRVNDIVEPMLGDNREIAPKNIANRVIMGYFGNTIEFLETAINSLKDSVGIIHYHDKFSQKDIPDKAFDQVRKIALNLNRKAELLKINKVKSFAPGINHYVLDLAIDEL